MFCSMTDVSMYFGCSIIKYVPFERLWSHEVWELVGL